MVRARPNFRKFVHSSETAERHRERRAVAHQRFGAVAYCADRTVKGA